MRLPPLTDPELIPFLGEGLWVAKIATHNPDGTVRMTPLTYAVGEGDEIVFSTWEDSAAVRNLQRNPQASVLVDKVDQPYAGVHYTGTAETGPEQLTPQQYAQLFGRYIGDLEQAAQVLRGPHQPGAGPALLHPVPPHRPRSPGTSARSQGRERPLRHTGQASPPVLPEAPARTSSSWYFSAARNARDGSTSPRSPSFCRVRTAIDGPSMWK